MEPILLNDNVLPRSMLIYKCPDQLKISEHYPPMSGTIFKIELKVKQRFQFRWLVIKGNETAFQ